MIEPTSSSSPNQPLRSNSPIVKGALSVVTVLLGAVLLTLTVRHLPAFGNATTISTATVSNGQVGIPYFQQLSGTDTNGSATAVTWTESGTALSAIGLSLSASGQITGTPTKVVSSYSFTVFANAPGHVSTARTYTINIYGRFSFQFGPPSVDQTVRTASPGATNVTMCTIVVRAIGENIRINRLTLYGLGSGSDTFDVARVKLWLDVNSNNVVDGGDVQIGGDATFSTVQGFNPSVTLNFGGNGLSGAGRIVDSDVNQGYETYIVTYDFKSTVESARTFRIGFLSTTDLVWEGVFSTGVSNSTVRSGGVVTTTFPGFLTNEAISYKGGIITIAGTAPLVPTLFMSDGGNIDSTTRSVAAGSTNIPALPLTFWADSAHQILVDRIAISDSGSGVASLQVSAAKLYYDLDRSATFTTGDLLIATETFTNNTVTFKNLSLLVHTPTGLPTDAGTLNLLVTYNISSNATPPQTFQARILSKTDVVARDLVTNTSVDLRDSDVPLAGNVISIVSGAASSLYVDSGTGGIYDAATPVTTASRSDSVVAWRGRFFASAGHRIRLTALRFTASGTLDDQYDISSIRLIKDRDNSGSITAGDVTIFSTTSYNVDNDSLQMSGLSEIIETPTGTNTDSNVLNLILVYNLNGNAPVIASPNQIYFQASLLAGSISASMADTSGSVSFISDTGIGGRIVRIDTYGFTAATASTGSGPFPTNATFTDADTSGTVSSGDYIVVAFDTNLLHTATAAASAFIVPVLGDDLGIGASVAFAGGNKMRITIGTSPTLTITGAYVAGTHGAGSASGINIKDTASATTLVSVYNRGANPATAAIDIGGALAAATTASGPFPTRIQYADADTTYGLSSGDQIVVTFSDNITANSVTKNNFTLPVVGDFFGATDPTISQTRGDQLTIRFNAQPTLTISGSFNALNLGAGNPSGLNLSGIINAIKDSQGRSAVPAAAALDIEGLDTGTSDSAPRPVSATYWDRDTSGTVNAGDALDIAFDKNITLTGAVPLNKLLMPKLGDIITNGSISQFGGNRLRVTLGTGDTFRVSGTFQPTALYETASSGINLASTISTIQDLQGRSAIPAAVALDIAGGNSASQLNDTYTATTTTTTTTTSSGGSSSGNSARGDAACLISRTPGLSSWSREFRVAREWFLESALGRLLVEFYHSL